MRFEGLAAVVREAVAPLRRKLGGMIARAVLDGLNDGGGFQVARVKVLADELLEAEHLQQGGVSHRAAAGAEGLVLFVAGQRDHPVALLLSERGARPTGLADGETVLYSTGANGGVKIRLSADGEVTITPTGTVTINGDLDVTGEVTANAGGGSSVSLSTHTHPTAMGPSGSPTPGS